jgi:hypothetical protein
MMRKAVFLVTMFLLSASALQAANIIWVDEGAADGFTGWQELLEGAGHTVTRRSDMGALDSDKIQAMNDADLVIMSRDTNSGSYANDATEIAQWNGLTVPFIQTSSYLIRNNRWLWVNSAGVPAIGASDNLVIVEDHPVFRGVGNAGDVIPMITSTVNITDSTDGGNGQVLATHTDGRLWIVYWEAETEFYSGSGQVPAGPRMWFGAGEGIDGATKGALDLTDEGKVIFLNAVTFLTGGSSDKLASNPLPVSGSVDVSPGGVLTWDPGEFAAEHDVYLGTRLEDVNNATTGDAAYRGRQAETSYAPAALDLGATYFWRIDEVNAPPDKTVFKGSVWSFTVEPVSFVIPIGAVTATASSTTGGQDPNNTVNGSGLNESDEHSNTQEDMWLADSDDATPVIQFEFAQLEKLDKVRVWNHNTQTESILGFGIKEALVEYSIDSENWVEFGTLTLAQGTGASTYTGEEIVLNGIVAKAVRITGLSNFSVLGLPQKGLSEVRFYAMPMRARLEIPATGSTGLDPLAELSWRSGRDAAQHEVLVGTDPDALTPVATVDDPTYTASLDLDSTIYWQVNEINDAMDPAVWEGDLWSLSTAEYLTVDDMEAYKSKEGFYVWETWLDGFGDDTNGALLGHGGDDMETDTVYDGSQSLPYYYGQGGAASSEASRDIERDWGQHGIVSISLMFYGATSNLPGQMYIKVNDAEIATYPVPSDLTIPLWQAWTIDLPAAALGNVNSLAIGVRGGTGLILIDAIRLYDRASEIIDPVIPDDADLVGHWMFDESSGTVASDSSGNNNHGTVMGDAFWVAEGKVGGALAFDGVDDIVVVTQASGLPIYNNGTDNAYSIAMWVMGGPQNDMRVFSESSSTSNNPLFNMGTHNSATPTGQYAAYIRPDTGTTLNHPLSQAEPFDDTWHHIAWVDDNGTAMLYVDGQLDGGDFNYTRGTMALDTTTIGGILRAAPSHFFTGHIDEVRIYKRALSQGEALGLAGRTEPIFKAF